MPFTRRGRVAPTPEYWNQSYNNDQGKWINPLPGELERVEQAMQLLGDVKGKRIIDLGGGPLMGKRLYQEGAERVYLVDISYDACRLALEIEPKVFVLVADAIEWLKSCPANTKSYHHDITLAMGLLDYCPNGSLEVLFKHCPSPLLLINSPVCEGYLEYETRTCIYSSKDYQREADQYGWQRWKWHPHLEHNFALYRRSK